MWGGFDGLDLDAWACLHCWVYSRGVRIWRIVGGRTLEVVGGDKDLAFIDSRAVVAGLGLSGLRGDWLSR
jgi:hypothetical protein